MLPEPRGKPSRCYRALCYLAPEHICHHCACRGDLGRAAWGRCPAWGGAPSWGRTYTLSAAAHPLLASAAHLKHQHNTSSKSGLTVLHESPGEPQDKQDMDEEESSCSQGATNKHLRAEVCVLCNAGSVLDVSYDMLSHFRQVGWATLQRSMCMPAVSMTQMTALSRCQETRTYSHLSQWAVLGLDSCSSLCSPVALWRPAD